jgi:hypothetical protein
MVSDAMSGSIRPRRASTNEKKTAKSRNMTAGTISTYVSRAHAEVLTISPQLDLRAHARKLRIGARHAHRDCPRPDPRRFDRNVREPRVPIVVRHQVASHAEYNHGCAPDTKREDDCPADHEQSRWPALSQRSGLSYWPSWNRPRICSEAADTRDSAQQRGTSSSAPRSRHGRHAHHRRADSGSRLPTSLQELARQTEGRQRVQSALRGTRARCRG